MVAGGRVVSCSGKVNFWFIVSQRERANLGINRESLSLKKDGQRDLHFSC